MRAITVGGALLAQMSVLGAVTGTPACHADAVAYLVNVTVRPGYNFPDADTALGYGRGLCDQVDQGVPFASLVRNTMADFSSTEEYQATYLISQAVNELCPQLIWQLRNSAAHYTGPTP
jgi:hypothetical protein